MSKMLKLADGREIDLSTKKVKEEEKPVVEEGQPVSFSPKPKQDLRLEDLPADTRMMNVVCAVVSYRIMGILDYDIARALGCTEAQLFDIVNSEAFTKTYDLVMDAFINGQQLSAKALISNNAVQAAQSLVQVMKSSKNENNRLRAAEGVLNRAGIGVDGANDGMGGGLMIKIIKDTSTSVELKVG